jgi:hypothetical protein
MRLKLGGRPVVQTIYHLGRVWDAESERVSKREFLAILETADQFANFDAAINKRMDVIVVTDRPL